MYDVMVLRPGGGYATDTTGPLSRCVRRVHDLAQSNRGRKAIAHIVDRRTGRKVT